MTTMLDELDTELQDGDTEESRFYEDFPDTAFTQDEKSAIKRFKAKEIEIVRDLYLCTQ